MWPFLGGQVVISRVAAHNLRPPCSGTSAGTRQVHSPGNITKDERRLVDISCSEQVETDLDRLIERRHDQRVQIEGERAAEELWAESERRYFARRREENRIAWCAYYRNIAGALYARGQEYLAEPCLLGDG
jgi:hypothetical protein